LTEFKFGFENVILTKEEFEYLIKMVASSNLDDDDDDFDFGDLFTDEELKKFGDLFTDEELEKLDEYLEGLDLDSKLDDDDDDDETSCTKCNKDCRESSNKICDSECCKKIEEEPCSICNMNGIGRVIMKDKGKKCWNCGQ